MNEDRKVEKYVPNRRFDSSLNSEGLANVIRSSIEGCGMLWLAGGCEGKVNLGSGFIDIGVYGDSVKNIRVEMSYDEDVVNRDKRSVRGVFGEIGLRKK